MNYDIRTPYAYSSCRTEITRCDAAPETHCVIHLWSEVRLYSSLRKANDCRVLIHYQQAPAPYVVDAFVSAMDDLCSRNDGSSVTRTICHPESTTRALVIRLPCPPGEEAGAMQRVVEMKNAAVRNMLGVTAVVRKTVYT